MKTAARKPIRLRPLIPGWCIMLAIPVTAVVTVWALRGKAGPDQGPSHEVPMQVQPQPSPPIAGVPPLTAIGLQKVAAARGGPPVIVAGSRRRHLDRGNCTRCHTVVRPNGARMPTIRSDSIMPHPYPGGQCINCHMTVPPLPGLLGVAFPRGMKPMQTNNKTPEAKWKGMEVAPITALTAMQFGTPAGINGAVVTEVEDKAAAAGVRAGDVVMAVNGAPVTDVMSFNAATQNGALPSGTVQVLRGGTLLEVPIDVQPIGGAIPGAPNAMPPPPGWGAAMGQAPAAAVAAQGTGCAPGAAMGQGMQGIQQGGEDNVVQLPRQGRVGVMNMGAAPGAMAPGQDGAAPF